MRDDHAALQILECFWSLAEVDAVSSCSSIHMLSTHECSRASTALLSTGCRLFILSAELRAYCFLP